MDLACQKSAIWRCRVTEPWYFLLITLSPPLLQHVLLLLVCIPEMTPALPLAQGASWVSQSDLSCWMPYDGLFVKLLCSVCSLSPPLSLLTVSPLWIWRALLCFARLIGATVDPERPRTHTSAHSVRASVDLLAHYLTFSAHELTFLEGFVGFNVQWNDGANMTKPLKEGPNILYTLMLWKVITC